MKHQVKLQIKEIHKDLANKIRKNKPYASSYSWEFRHRHVAYCLLRGRTIEQIEPKVREGNERSERLVEKYKDEYTEMFNKLEVSDEAVHTCG